MLDTIDKPLLTTSRRVSGQFLSKNRLGKHDRGRLGRDIRRGRVEVTNLTTKQIARLCRTTAYLVNVADKPRATALIKAWNKATPVERVEFVHSVGTEAVFDAVVAAID
jgi:hypothetical protein